MTRQTRQPRIARFAPAIGALVLLAAPAAASAGTATVPASSPADFPAEPCPVPGSVTATETSVAAQPPVTATAPAGTVMAQSAKAGIRFAVPAEFTAVDPVKLQGLDNSQMPPAIVAMAKGQGMDVGPFLAALAARTDLIIAGPAVDGFSPNINVLTQPSAVLPSEAEITAQLAQLGATNAKVTPITTSLGQGVLASFDLILGAKTISGRQVGVVTSGGSALISITTGDAALSDSIAQTIVSTLQPLDSGAAPAAGSDGSSCIRVSSARAGVSFVVPSDYEATDPAALLNLDESLLPPEMVALAASQGVTLKEMLERNAQRSDLMVLGPEVDGVTANVNVLSVVSAMPTSTDLESELNTAGITPTITTESTPVGDALFATYQLPLNGRPAEARQIVAHVAPNLVIVTVVTADAATADRLATNILLSLATAG